MDSHKSSAKCAITDERIVIPSSKLVSGNAISTKYRELTKLHKKPLPNSSLRVGKTADATFELPDNSKMYYL